MGKVYTIDGGVGGTMSDEVTAHRVDVLKGRTTITSDSSDEIVAGTMPDNTTRTSNGNVPGMSSHPEIPTRDGANMHIQPDTTGTWRLHVAPPHGYYNGGVYISRPAAELGDARPENVLQTDTFTSERGLRRQGTMPKKEASTAGVGAIFFQNFLFVRIEPGGYLTATGSGYPEVRISSEQLRQALGIDPAKILNDTSIAGVQGTLPRWQSIGSNAITVYNGESAVWDDVHHNRGRGILSRIPNGHKIEGADWVFLPAPDLVPENIRAGKKISNITGTMVDYSAGRVVFYNATFDGTLVSSVARANSSYQLDPSETAAINPSRPFLRRLDFHNSSSYSDSARTVFRHSLNLAPFRRMRIQYRCSGRQSSDSGREKTFFMEVRFLRANNKSEITRKTFFHYATYDSSDWSEVWPWSWAEIDISDINEQVFVVYEYRLHHAGGDSFHLTADFDINYIELIN